MADTKITALTALTAADPANDVIPIVDVSDTSMAASGTTKKISVNNILGASGTATLASATITGDLTVDTSTLKVDSANNRVGVGTVTPADSLHIFGAGNALIEGSAGIYAKAITKVGAKSWQFGYRSGTLQYEIQEDGVERYTIGNGGTPHNWYIGASTAMTLNSTGLGVGGSPQTKFHVIDSSGVCALFTKAAAPSAALSAIYIQAPVSSGFSSTPVLNFWYQNTGISNPASECFAIRTNSTDRLYVDATGNVGIGVTPSAWAVSYKSIEVGAIGSFANDPTNVSVGANRFFNGTNSIYKTTAAASVYNQTAGTHAWYTAPSGTAGNAITFTQAMTLDASGNLLVGTTGTVVSAISRFRVSTAAASAIDAKTTVATDAVIDSWNSATSGDNTFHRFWTEGTVTFRGGIDYNRAGGLVRYNTTSDYRAKDIIGPVSNSGSLIDSLKVYVGKMHGATIERPMLIAHEAQAVAPYAVSGTKDDVDAEGKPKYQQMDVSALVPLLIAEIQSLRARVQTLETR